MSEYTCDQCNKTYEKPNNEEWNDLKAAEEYVVMYPDDKNAPTNIICDDCYKQFSKWFEKLTEDEKRKMREEYK